LYDSLFNGVKVYPEPKLQAQQQDNQRLANAVLPNRPERLQDAMDLDLEGSDDGSDDGDDEGVNRGRRPARAVDKKRKSPEKDTIKQPPAKRAK
jgi:hypothetical protein